MERCVAVLFIMHEILLTGQLRAKIWVTGLFTGTDTV